MLYDLKLVREEDTLAKMKQVESGIQDLLAVLPTVKKHKIDAVIGKKIRTLRNSRTQKNYCIELSRELPRRGQNTETQMGTQEIVIGGKKFLSEMVVGRKETARTMKVSAPITRRFLKDGEDDKLQQQATAENFYKGKVQLLRSLKSQILTEVRRIRKESVQHSLTKNKKGEYLSVESRAFREGISVPVLAECYLEPGTFLKIMNKRVRRDMTRGNKRPLTRDDHIGVEIEVASKETIEQVCDKLFEAGLGRHIDAKRDGSIHVDDAHPNQVELAIIAKQPEIKDVIKRVCDVLNKQCTVKVDKSCGLHVHLDMRNRGVEKCFANLILMQRYLYAMSPAARKLPRKEGTNGRVVEGFSQPIESTAWKIPADHYFGVNTTTYNKFQTIEIRMHCGTTQARKINNFIEFLTTIVEGDTLVETPENMRLVQEVFNMKDSLTKYIESRIAKFASQHKKLPNPKWMGNTETNAKADDEDPEDSEVA